MYYKMNEDPLNYCLDVVTRCIAEVKSQHMTIGSIDPVYYDENELNNENLPSVRRNYLYMKRESRERIVFVKIVNKFYLYDDDCVTLRRRGFISPYIFCDDRPIFKLSPSTYLCLTKQLDRHCFSWTYLDHDKVNDWVEEIELLKGEVEVLKKFIDENF